MTESIAILRTENGFQVQVHGGYYDGHLMQDFDTMLEALEFVKDYWNY